MNTQMKPKLKICAVVVFALLLISVDGCDRDSKTADAKTNWVDPNKLEPGPIRHASLTEEQMTRVRHVQKTFSQVDSSPIEKWVEDFQRDANPDRELSLWETMANAYETYTSSKNLGLDAKKEVFQVVLLRSGAPDEEVLKHLKLKVLTEKDAKEIMADFTAKPEPIRIVSP